jgi:septal ring factor EnvC (AmiA/AmiB activator)
MAAVSQDQQTDALTAWLATFTVEPFALSVAVTQQVLGDKALSTLYEAGARGDLEFIKDGAKTLITLASIKRYIAAMRPAVLTPTPRRPENRRRLKMLTEQQAAARRAAN